MRRFAEHEETEMIEENETVSSRPDAKRPREERSDEQHERLVIKPCPCGKTPEKLYIHDTGQGGKWANANGDCCGEWEIEFRTDYLDYGSDECMALAIAAWNAAPRAL